MQRDRVRHGLAGASSEIASLALSRMTVPVVHYLVRRREIAREKARASEPGAAPVPVPAE